MQVDKQTNHFDASTTEIDMTAEQLKKKFESEGKTFADWARQNSYDVTSVYRVINGFTKAKRGKSHDIAVKLGLKADPARQAA